MPSRWPQMPPSLPELSGRAAIVGVGETDYGSDYRAARAKDPGHEKPTTETLAKLAFERALADSGLTRDDIDGLTVSFMYGGPDPTETAAMLGLQPNYAIENVGIMAGPLPVACAAIAEGKCDTIAMIYSVATRSIGRKFGGVVHEEDGGAPASYYYYHPWGWSSQAAHWALTWQYYKQTYGVTDADLGAVAVQLRENAMRHPQAIMHKLLTIQDYLAARQVVRPLRLLDLCLVNDGAVCLIVRRADMARDLSQVPISVTGWGEARVKCDKLDALVRKRLHPQFQEAGRQALAMAGLGLPDIQHFEAYDASTIHLINHLEGHGFVEPGAGLEFCKSGAMAVGGALPVNVAGGMLSGSYMHGWNHIAEITRQLRHEADKRQIHDVAVSMFSLAQTDRVHPLILQRGVSA